MRSWLTSLLILVALSATAFAASCASLGPGGSDSFPSEFTISAKDPTTGAVTPLHLVAFMTVPGTTYHVLSTGTSPAVFFTDFSMAGGLITALSPTPTSLSDAQSLGAKHLDVSGFAEPGPFVMWANTLAPPSEIFCAIPQSDGTAILALNGHTDLFVICHADMSSTAPNIRAVVYNATLSAYELGVETYNGDTCTPATLLAVPLS